MPIIISNDGSNPRAVGEHGYVLSINNKVICKFTHQREEGLSQCLRRAADAVAKEEVLKWVEVSNNSPAITTDIGNPAHPDHHKTRVISSPFNPEYK